METVKTYTFRVRDKIDFEKIEENYKQYEGKISKSNYLCDCILSYIDKTKEISQMNEILEKVSSILDKAIFSVELQRCLFELVGCNNEILKSMLMNSEFEQSVENGIFDNIPMRFKHKLNIDT